MSKIKAIITGLVILLIFSLCLAVYFLNESNRKKDIEIARLDFNSFQLLQDNRQQTVLYLKEKEVSGQLKRERDSIALALKVKPKQIEKIIYQTVTDIDTVNIEVPVYVTTKNSWKISDTINKCTVYKADLKLVQDSLHFTRTEFSYNNKTTETYFKKRSRKFLGIPIGKWVYYKELSSECGKTQQTTFNFVK